MRLALTDVWHERILPAWLLALGFLLLGLPMARATGMGAPSRAALDFALWWSWLFGCALALWLGSRCIARPLTDGTAAWELAGPTAPATWGLRRLAAASVGAIGPFVALALPALGLAGAGPGAGAFLLLTGLELVLLTTLAGALGSLFRPLPALALAAALWSVGHLGGVWLDVMVASGQETLATLVLAAIPDLDLLDVHGSVVRGQAPPPSSVLVAAGWSLAWTCASAAATVAVLQRRDLA